MKKILPKKNKIATKLIMSFSATLVLFSVIIVSLFMLLFRNHTLNIYKSDMEKRANAISLTLSNIILSNNPLGGSSRGNMMQRNGVGAYFKYLGEIAMSDVWVVDENMNLMITGRFASSDYNYSDLPENADKMVKEVFGGKTSFSEGFSELLNTNTLTVGTPIFVDGIVVGAVLLHSPVSGINELSQEGFAILSISIVIALILSSIVSIKLSISFTKPLREMKTTALKLVDGDYSAKTSITLDDEIGELASTIDILSERLDIASKESYKLQKLRQDFIANISHELRTPVTVIRGSLEALYDEVVSDKTQVKEYHKQLLLESKYLERLINDLLDLSRLQNTDFIIQLDELNLVDVLSDVVRSGRNISRHKNIEISFKSDIEAFITRGDYGRLRQMFLIIIDNATKFSKENSLISVALEDNTVKISDSGCGIDEKDLPHIFERFYKEKNENNKTGTGLGLAIAKQIGDRHGIKVAVQSTKGIGTEFTFIFKEQDTKNV